MDLLIWWKVSVILNQKLSPLHRHLTAILSCQNKLYQYKKLKNILRCLWMLWQLFTQYSSWLTSEIWSKDFSSRLLSLTRKMDFYHSSYFESGLLSVSRHLSSIFGKCKTKCGFILFWYTKIMGWTKSVLISTIEILKQIEFSPRFPLIAYFKKKFFCFIVLIFNF